MSKPGNDRELAERLARPGEAAHGEFVHEFQVALDAGDHRFRNRVPDCGRSPDSLSPHVGFVTGRGYCKSAGNGDTPTLSEYVDRLMLPDLTHASAVLDWTAWPVKNPTSDPAAVEALRALVQERIRPTLLKRFGKNQCVEDASDEVSGHVLMPGANGEVRLNSYEGRSLLVTWLTATAFRLVLSCLRTIDRAAVGEAECEAAGQPEGADDKPAGPEPAWPFVRRFYPHMVEVVEGIREPARQQWLDHESNIPEREKEKYRKGLTDKQKNVFRLLYFRGIEPARVAKILHVTKPYISQCIRKYCERLAVLAEGVINELADQADVDRSEIVEELKKLFEFLASVKWDSEWDDVTRDMPWLQDFLDDLRRNREQQENDEDKRTETEDDQEEPDQL